ncbi:MAG: hypothetical protein G8345_14825, partial [Magnetococcales bacterium]|nr:hypothetical protein [Magnetococcales bacterium]
QAIERAVTSCRESGNNPDHHFAGVGKMVELGSGSLREVPDFHLSRFACYLIAQNGDPRKAEIAEAQKYFAVQTRRQELSDHMLADQERLELRHQASEEFKALSNAARQAGVQSRMFGIFHDAGYKGLYGGLGCEAIKQRKSIPDKDNLMDRMNATELAANQFRMTQTRASWPVTPPMINTWPFAPMRRWGARCGMPSNALAACYPRTYPRLNIFGR